MYPLDLLLVQIEQQKELRNRNSKTTAYIRDQRSGYSQQELDNVEIIYFDNDIYVQLTTRRCVLYFYHFYINHPGGIRLANIIRQV